MPAKKMEIRCITYGLGNTLDISKFNPIENDWVKPKGGLWASPVGANFGWKDWCEVESFGDLNTSFTFTISGMVYTIDTLRDLEVLPQKFVVRYKPVLDFEKILAAGIQAIYLTENGQNKTRFSQPIDLYGWDCECVLVMDSRCIAP